MVLVCGYFEKSSTSATLRSKHQRYCQPRRNKGRLLGLHKLHLRKSQPASN